MSQAARFHNPLSQATEAAAKRAAHRAGRLWLQKCDDRYRLVTTADPQSGWTRFGPGYVLEDDLTLDGAIRFCQGVR
jgi:hypothetical protein